MGDKKKPDMYAENKAVMPYGDNVSAPAIRKEDIVGWKQEQSIKTNHYFKARYDEIKEEYLKLMELFEWNELVYKSQYSFIPIKGNTYYLYQRKNDTLFLSLIEPQYWDQIFMGAFKLDSDDKWIKVD
jgi:hypothetical protein